MRLIKSTQKYQIVYVEYVEYVKSYSASYYHMYDSVFWYDTIGLVDSGFL